ncbi:MAG: hypothetical protein A2808_00660 [Candidatus Moranbacteria bacterium RIFCSPHIGHO2_01_FULL_55_24]|nr:MAG: hypothetical protein A2808_00660 [Candidatus Moranbacteria bacterium RIFCSPHIGHO2_01_FULL_55_24]
MSQTFYIESDEEIISVIGRLRKSSEGENIFVFPKRALVLQSIVNLRLFQREAQKLGKKIIVVTQDETGRMLAEKAGVETETYSDDFSQKANHVEIPVPARVPNTPPKGEAAPASPEMSQSLPRSENIGSSDFFGGSMGIVGQPHEESAPPSAPLQDMQTLRVRNAAPERPPSLNSLRHQEAQAIHETPRENLAQRPNLGEKPTAAPLPSARPEPNFGTGSYSGERQDALKRFFGQEQGIPSPASAPVRREPASAPAPKPSSQKPRSPQVHHAKAKGVLFVLGGLSLLCVIGVAAFLFFPKVEVRITPFETAEKSDLNLVGMVGAEQGASDKIPVRLEEKEIPITVTETATGSSASSSQKARGSIVIYNEFSKDPQSLVATTRFETPDGKIFRLTESITVPGMTSEPGAIEAQVMADQTGEEYNVAPTTFTIPGFKGSPKYEKFSGKSVKNMTGGGNTGSDIATITKADLEKAENNAKEKAKETFLAEVNSRLAGDEKLLSESLEITPLETANLPKTGTVATTFEYTRSYKARAFAVSEDIIKKQVLQSLNTEVNGVTFKAGDTRIDFGEIAPNYDAREVRMKVHAETALQAAIDQDKLKHELLGKDTAGIQQVLESYPGVSKIELLFKPDWFGSSIPASESRVTITIVSSPSETSGAAE